MDLAGRQVRIHIVYLDWGFCCLDWGFCAAGVIRELRVRKLRFRMLAAMDRKVKAVVSGAVGRTVIEYHGGRVEYGQVQPCRGQEIGGREESVRHESPNLGRGALFDLYGKRWGIEAGYRTVTNSFAPRTTSRATSSGSSASYDRYASRTCGS